VEENKNKVYKAASYVRLSKDDGDFSTSEGKKESNSISNQKQLIRRYVENHPEIELVDEWEDDGYTGTNFDRPGFLAMMDAVKAHYINCIIVKDLSRFGRDYIISGKYIQKIFPALGVRFIAINDDYDSLNENSMYDDLVLPLRNILNDNNSRSTSISVRIISTLDARMENS
jgi:site-specific DNA recombinase